MELKDLSAADLLEAARTAAALLPKGACITLSASADEITTRAVSALLGTQYSQHLTVWPDKSASVIYSAGGTLADGVSVHIQGSRPATPADVELLDARHYRLGEKATSAEVMAAIEKPDIKAA